jgi:membrane-associated phospholipid phosphatase
MHRPLPGLWRHILTAALLGALIAGCYHFVDRPAVVWASGLDRQIVVVFKKITLLGSSTPYLISLAVLYPALRFGLRRAAAAKRALFVLAAVVVSGGVVDLVKPIVARWRPKAFFADPSHYGFGFFNVGYEHNSFPSGHATTAAAVACALTLLYPRLRVLWLCAAAVVASSRVVVGAHYPGDVLAGAWFGVVITLALSHTAWFREVLQAPAGGRQPARDIR